MNSFVGVAQAEAAQRGAGSAPPVLTQLQKFMNERRAEFLNLEKTTMPTSGLTKDTYLPPVPPALKTSCECSSVHKINAPLYCLPAKSPKSSRSGSPKLVAKSASTPLSRKSEAKKPILATEPSISSTENTAPTQEAQDALCIQLFGYIVPEQAPLSALDKFRQEQAKLLTATDHVPDLSAKREHSEVGKSIRFHFPF